MLTNTVIKETFGDLRAQQISAIIFPALRCVISHRVRLSLIVYSLTSQKKWLQIPCIINQYVYPLKKHNLDLLCWARYVSICSIYLICQKSSHIDFC